MPLQSKLLALDPMLVACSNSQYAQFSTGEVGEHVSKIHTALFLLDGVSVDELELQGQIYGPSTAQAVVSFKRRRNLIDRMYQPDNVVNRITISAMDREVFAIERVIAGMPTLRCA